MKAQPLIYLGKTKCFESGQSGIDKIRRSDWLRIEGSAVRDKLFEKCSIDVSTNSNCHITRLRRANYFVKCLECNLKWIKCHIKWCRSHRRSINRWGTRRGCTRLRRRVCHRCTWRWSRHLGLHLRHAPPLPRSWRASYGATSFAPHRRCACD